MKGRFYGLKATESFRERNGRRVLACTFELAEAVHSFHHAIPVLICAKPASGVLPHVGQSGEFPVRTRRAEKEFLI